MKKKLKIKTKVNLQNLVVITGFIVVLGIISYPIITQRQGLLAEPSRDLHLEMKDSSEKEAKSCNSDGLILSIFGEN